MTRPIATTVVEFATFRAKSARFLSDEERSALVDFIAANPKCGREFEGTGGIRHLRWPLPESGGQEKALIGYYHCDKSFPLLLITAIKPGGKNLLAEIVRVLATSG
jgi:hypothetical protein